MPIVVIVRHASNFWVRDTFMRDIRRQADIVVTHTPLELEFFGGKAYVSDGDPYIAKLLKIRRRRQMSRAEYIFDVAKEYAINIILFILIIVPVFLVASFVEVRLRLLKRLRR